MSADVTSTNTELIFGPPPHISEFRRFANVFFARKIVMIGLVIVVLFLIMAIFSPFVAPQSPYDTNLSEALSNPTGAHILGTDALGRDTASRIVYGARTSLVIGIVVILIGGILGMGLGMIAGFFGGWTYQIIMRIMDAFMAFPMILLTLMIAGTLGGGMKNVIVALSIGMIPAYARMMCSQVLAIKENDYIMAERSMGASNPRIMLSHIFPNSLPPLIVMITMQLGMVILAEAGLSYLGIGIEQPIAAWGSMVLDGQNYLLTRPILSFAPGIAIMLVVFAFNMVGDGLRDALDPRLRGIL